MLFTELRIMELMRSSPHGPRVAELLALAQRVAFTKANHILIVGDEKTWRALRKVAKSGDIHHLPVRCARCGAVATLYEWYVLCAKGVAGYHWLLQRVPVERRLWLLPAARPCRGDIIAADLFTWVNAEVDTQWRE